jgi:hypothetical protein
VTSAGLPTARRDAANQLVSSRPDNAEGQPLAEAGKQPQVDEQNGRRDPRDKLVNAHLVGENQTTSNAN